MKVKRALMGAGAILLIGAVAADAGSLSIRTVRFTCRAGDPEFHPFFCDTESPNDTGSCTFCFAPSLAFIVGCSGGGRLNPCRVLPIRSCSTSPLSEAPQDNFTVALPSGGKRPATLKLKLPVANSRETVVLLHCRVARKETESRPSRPPDPSPSSPYQNPRTGLFQPLAGDRRTGPCPARQPGAGVGGSMNPAAARSARSLAISSTSVASTQAIP